MRFVTPPPEVLAALRKYDTPTICNVIELLDCRPRTTGYMDGRIRACFPQLPPAVGYAVTATFRAGAEPGILPGTGNGAKFPICGPAVKGGDSSRDYRAADPAARPGAAAAACGLRTQPEGWCSPRRATPERASDVRIPGQDACPALGRVLVTEVSVSVGSPEWDGA